MEPIRKAKLDLVFASDASLGGPKGWVTCGKSLPYLFLKSCSMYTVKAHITVHNFQWMHMCVRSPRFCGAGKLMISCPTKICHLPHHNPGGLHRMVYFLMQVLMACTILLCLNPELTVFGEARCSKDHLWSEDF